MPSKRSTSRRRTRASRTRTRASRHSRSYQRTPRRKSHTRTRRVGSARRGKPATLARSTQNQLTAHTAKAMVLTCMDFRLIDDAVAYLNSQGYNNNYDEFILAGASLGYNQTAYSAWTEAFDKHVELAKQLHHIHEVIVIDHMSCGAYKLLYNKPSLTAAEEVALHKENFARFRQTMRQKYPECKVKTLLMQLDGTVVDGTTL